ncbi:hypothetical protein JW949_03715 [Candidatus Woesearchaeota archaeon]|nr:hypothetical protein [Candidatus Woesearchaeota archaeon]
MKINRIYPEDKEKKAYSEINPDFDITVHWFKELAKKYGLVIGEGPLYEKPEEDNIPYQNKKT